MDVILYGPREIKVYDQSNLMDVGKSATQRVEHDENAFHADTSIAAHIA
jgi:hypothetical protein